MQTPTERRDTLMSAARNLKTWIDDTKAQRVPPRKMAMPGAVVTMQACVRLAREQNHIDIRQRTQSTDCPECWGIGELAPLVTCPTCKGRGSVDA